MSALFDHAALIAAAQTAPLRRIRDLQPGGGGGVIPPPGGGGGGASGYGFPLQGGFNRGQKLADWMGIPGPVWFDAGNPLQNATNPKNFVLNVGSGFTPGNGQPMRHPRPAKVRFYWQGFVPILNFTYAEAAANTAAFQNAWKKIGNDLLALGYTELIIGSAETNQGWKAWMPSAADITSGRWTAAWKNMVRAIRSTGIKVKFAFVPFSSADGAANLPGNGVNSKDAWYVAGVDENGEPWMDFWGATLYFNSRGAGCKWPNCQVTNSVIDQSMAHLKSETSLSDQNWSTMGHIMYARTKGIPTILGEFGIADRMDCRFFHMGDKPYAIDVLYQFCKDFKDDIYAVIWFNSKHGEQTPCGPNWPFYTAVDGGPGSDCPLPNAALRVRDTFGRADNYTSTVPA